MDVWPYSIPSKTTRSHLVDMKCMQKRPAGSKLVEQRKEQDIHHILCEAQPSISSALVRQS